RDGCGWLGSSKAKDSDRANCAGEDSTRERQRFEGSCRIHEQLWANSTRILPPPRFCQVSLLSLENGFLKETRFLSAIAWGRSGLGCL
ncbi:MAG: hypothetical protein ACKPAE_12795, partial [Microcystis panniformis]